MEGVTDSPMRALYTERGGFTFCVSEFLRVSQTAPPAKVFFTHIPELKHGCKTPAGVPIQVQLLGGNAKLMAQSALTAVKLGAKAIDINFGCPAPTVNRHDGGATLLKYPERIKEIVSSIRQALPLEVPVSAKLRLGWDNLDSIYVNAQMAADGGASWITIHARTKVQGYAPPVSWKHIGEVRRQLSIPVVANGDIWSFEDFKKCQDQTQCQHFMLGRGAMADPLLPLQVAQELGILNTCVVNSFDWKILLEKFNQYCQPVSPAPQYAVGRIKQWLKMAHNQKKISWFDNIKLAKSTEEIFKSIPRG